MILSFEPDREGTRVTVVAINVPEGIEPEDHRAANSLLALEPTQICGNR